MKYITTCLLLLASTSTFAQQITYPAWQEESKTNMRLLPEYGNRTKTHEQKNVDEEFIQTSLKQDGTSRKASDHLVEIGYKYFNRGDIKTAMYRFNQSWLLDPKNENAYWGFGAIYFHFNDLENATKMYDQGLKLNPNSSNILTDKATIYMTMLNDKFDEKLVKKAVDLFNKSYAVDPKNPNTTFKLSTLYFSINDCEKAKKYYDICNQQGGQPITNEYTSALKEKCK